MALSLTSLVGGDVDRRELRGEGALVGDAVHSLDLKGVLGVGQEVADVDARLRQAQLARRELHVVPAAGAGPPARAAALADDVINQILPAPRVPGRAPLQHQGSLVHARDDRLGGGGDGCGEDRENQTVKRQSISFPRTVRVGPEHLEGQSSPRICLWLQM